MLYNRRRSNKCSCCPGRVQLSCSTTPASSARTSSLTSALRTTAWSRATSATAPWCSGCYRRGRGGIIRLAARAGMRPSLRQPVLYEEVNCVATLHLLEAAVARGPARLPVRVVVVGLRDQLEAALLRGGPDRAANLPLRHDQAGRRAPRLRHHLHGLQAACLQLSPCTAPPRREMAIARFIRCLRRRADPVLRRRRTHVDCLHEQHRRRVEAALRVRLHLARS